MLLLITPEFRGRLRHCPIAHMPPIYLNVRTLWGCGAKGTRGGGGVIFSALTKEWIAALQEGLITNAPPPKRLGDERAGTLIVVFRTRG